MAGPRCTTRSASTSMAPARRMDGTILVMYTDGADSRSKLRLDELMKMLHASQVTVYAVGLVENTGADAHRVDACA